MVIDYSESSQPTMNLSKPPYLVPSMADISALPWNGFNAISTFSGCGGSSTGYRMAGFKVLWASEFIDAARFPISSSGNSVVGLLKDSHVP